MELFYTPTSPYARRARIVARERGLMDKTEETLATPYHDDPKLLAVNPAGLVPALALDDGMNLIDSTLICEYLDAVGQDTAQRATQGEARWHDQKDSTLANLIMDFAVAATMERLRTDSPPSQSFIGRKREKIKRCLLSLRKRSEATTSLGDISTACALSYLDLRDPNLDWRSLRPDLVDWHTVMESRPAFQETLPDEQKN